MKNQYVAVFAIGCLHVLKTVFKQLIFNLFSYQLRNKLAEGLPYHALSGFLND